MNVESILRTKGRSVVTIRPDAHIEAAIALLRRHDIGAVVVSSDGLKIEGLLSERDIVHALAGHGAEALALAVSEIMTRRVVTCGPEDSVADLMSLMTDRRIRHLPVLRDGVLGGMVSIGDVVKNRLDEIEGEASSMREFIAGA
jgi:CBS domain-containing protein